MPRTGIFALLLVLSACASSTPGWKAYAACAAAYQVNAAQADPGRAASMTAMVSEVADEYLTAARARQSDEEAVDAYVRNRAAAFRGQSRERVESFIEACPQTEPSE